MKMVMIFTFIPIFFFLSYDSLAQANAEKSLEFSNTIVVEGVVRPLGNLSPIVDALIFDKSDREKFVRTDSNGYFKISISKSSTGIAIRAENYLDFEVPIIDGKLSKPSPYLLEPERIYGGTGIIRARRKNEVSQNSFSQEEIAKIPGTGGDAVRGLQTLPSVLPAAIGSADLVVRGGTPGDNSYFYDDLLLPFVFHFGGAETIIPTRMIESMDFYPGGFSSYYTDTIGGVIQLRGFGNVPKRTSGEIEAGLIQSGIFMEGQMFGPENSGTEKNNTTLVDEESTEISDNKTEDTGIGYRAGFRRTYLEIYKPIIQKFAKNSNFFTIPQATDYQLVLNGKHSRGTWRAYLLGVADRASLSTPLNRSTLASGNTDFSFYNYLETSGFRYSLNLGKGIGLRFLFQQRYFLIEQKFFGNDIDIKSHLFGLGVILDRKINSQVSYSMGVRPKFQYSEVGVNAIQFPSGGFTSSFDPDLAPVVKETIYTHDFYGDFFVDFLYSPEKFLVFNPGINVLQGSQKNMFAADPRVGVRYEFVKDNTLKAAIGYYSQMPQPQYSSPKYGNPDLSLERSSQVVVGWECKFLEDYLSDIQVWYKKSDNLVGPAVNNPANKYENSIETRAKGLEFFLKKKLSGIWYGWLSYGLMQSEQRDPLSGIWRFSNYDRTHSFNLVYGQKLTGRWGYGTRVQYISGSPYSSISGGTLNQNTGIYAPVNDGNKYLISKNDQRNPYFFQVDFRTEYDFLFQDWTLTTYLNILNILNWNNVTNTTYTRDYSDKVEVSGLPIIPTVGVIAKF